MTKMKLVIIESSYAGEVEENLKYLHRSALDCLERGESPQASHGWFTQFLDDANPEHRKMGIAAGLAWRRVADYSVFYTDRGWSRGMIAALKSALEEGRKFELRYINYPGGIIFPDYPDYTPEQRKIIWDSADL